jgi:hypothetical protein
MASWTWFLLLRQWQRKQQQHVPET